MEDLKKEFKRTEDHLNRQRQERPKSRSSAPRAPLSVEERALERDEEQSKKQDEVRKGNFLQKNGADGFTD